MDPVIASELSSSAACLKLEPELRLLGMSLWIDGVACKWDRSESIEMITLLLVGLPDPRKNLRVPVFAIDRFSVWKERTIDDALRIIQWSPDF